MILAFGCISSRFGIERIENVILAGSMVSASFLRDQERVATRFKFDVTDVAWCLIVASLRNALQRYFAAFQSNFLSNANLSLTRLSRLQMADSKMQPVARSERDLDIKIEPVKQEIDSTASVSMNSLPSRVLVHQIFAFLNAHDLASISCTNRSLHALANVDAAWQVLANGSDQRTVAARSLSWLDRLPTRTLQDSPTPLIQQISVLSYRKLERYQNICLPRQDRRWDPLCGIVLADQTTKVTRRLLRIADLSESSVVKSGRCVPANDGLFNASFAIGCL